MIYLIRGLPGSGKTTYAHKLGCILIEADQYFVREGKYQFKREVIEKAHLWCFEMFVRACATDIDVAVANTFSQKWELERYTRWANNFELPYMIINVVSNDPNRKSIHGVPEHTIERMKNRWESIVGEVITIV